jgi:hypothetical protein
MSSPGWTRQPRLQPNGKSGRPHRASSPSFEGEINSEAPVLSREPGLIAAFRGLRPCDPSRRDTLLHLPAPFPSLTSVCGRPRSQGSASRNCGTAMNAHKPRALDISGRPRRNPCPLHEGKGANANRNTSQPPQSFRAQRRANNRSSSFKIACRVSLHARINAGFSVIEDRAGACERFRPTRAIQPVLTAGAKEEDMKFTKELNQAGDADRRSS